MNKATFTYYNVTDKDVTLKPNVVGTHSPIVIEAHTYESFDKATHDLFSLSIRNLSNKAYIIKQVDMPVENISNDQPEDGSVLTYQKASGTWEPKKTSASGDVTWSDVKNKPELYTKDEVDTKLESVVKTNLAGKVDASVLPDEVVQTSGGKIDANVLPNEVVLSENGKVDVDLLPDVVSSVKDVVTAANVNKALIINGDGTVRAEDLPAPSTGVNKFVQLTDVDGTVLDTDGKYLKVENGAVVASDLPADDVGAKTIGELSDVDNDLINNDGKYLKVESGQVVAVDLPADQDTKKFENLEDVSVTLASDSNKFLRVNAAGNAVEAVAPAFKDLTDGFDLTGHADKFVAVSSDGKTLEAVDKPNSLPDTSSATEGQVLTLVDESGTLNAKWQNAPKGKENLKDLTDAQALLGQGKLGWVLAVDGADDKFTLRDPSGWSTSTGVSKFKDLDDTQGIIDPSNKDKVLKVNSDGTGLTVADDADTNSLIGLSGVDANVLDTDGKFVKVDGGKLVATDAPREVPTGGATDQVLTHTGTSYEWKSLFTQLTAVGGTTAPGNVLTLDSSGNPEWTAPASVEGLPDYSSIDDGKVLKVKTVSGEKKAVWDDDEEGSGSDSRLDVVFGDSHKNQVVVIDAAGTGLTTTAIEGLPTNNRTAGNVLSIDAAGNPVWSDTFDELKEVEGDFVEGNVLKVINKDGTLEPAWGTVSSGSGNDTRVDAVLSGKTAADADKILVLNATGDGFEAKTKAELSIGSGGGEDSISSFFELDEVDGNIDAAAANANKLIVLGDEGIDLKAKTVKEVVAGNISSSDLSDVAAWMTDPTKYNKNIMLTAAGLTINEDTVDTSLLNELSAKVAEAGATESVLTFKDGNLGFKGVSTLGSDPATDSLGTLLTGEDANKNKLVGIDSNAQNAVAVDPSLSILSWNNVSDVSDTYGGIAGFDAQGDPVMSGKIIKFRFTTSDDLEGLDDSTDLSPITVSGLPAGWSVALGYNTGLTLTVTHNTGLLCTYCTVMKADTADCSKSDPGEAAVRLIGKQGSAYIQLNNIVNNVYVEDDIIKSDSFTIKNTLIGDMITTEVYYVVLMML